MLCPSSEELTCANEVSPADRHGVDRQGSLAPKMDGEHQRPGLTGYEPDRNFSCVLLCNVKNTDNVAKGLKRSELSLTPNRSTRLWNWADLTADLLQGISLPSAPSDQPFCGPSHGTGFLLRFCSSWGTEGDPSALHVLGEFSWKAPHCHGTSCTSGHFHRPCPHPGCRQAGGAVVTADTVTHRPNPTKQNVGHRTLASVTWWAEDKGAMGLAQG